MSLFSAMCISPSAVAGETAAELSPGEEKAGTTLVFPPGTRLEPGSENLAVVGGVLTFTDFSSIGARVSDDAAFKAWRNDDLAIGLLRMQANKALGERQLSAPEILLVQSGSGQFFYSGDDEAHSLHEGGIVTLPPGISFHLESGEVGLEVIVFHSYGEGDHPYWAWPTEELDPGQ